MTDYNERHRKVVDEHVRINAEGADDLAKRWINMLTLGNGAALLGAVNIVNQAPHSDLVPALIISLWLFLIGIGCGGGCTMFLGSAWRSDETYWRLSDADRIRKGGKQESKHLEAIQKASADSDKFTKWAANCGLGACLSFVVGIAIPLTVLSCRAVRLHFFSG